MSSKWKNWQTHFEHIETTDKQTPFEHIETIDKQTPFEHIETTDKYTPFEHIETTDKQTPLVHIVFAISNSETSNVVLFSNKQIYPFLTWLWPWL